MTDARASTAGVLLAAGRGRRMGRLKQLLAWRNGTVVSAAFDALAPSCGAGLFVVLGDDAEAITGALGDRPLHAVASDSDAEQIASVRLGLGAALKQRRVERILLHPADHPIIPPLVLDALLERSTSEDRVLIPTCGDRGGHPALIPRPHAESIVRWGPGVSNEGLRGFWTAHPEIVRHIDFPDAPALLMDLDTPADYADARAVDGSSS